MSKPRLIDFFCCQGAASKGYADAGFDVTGVDITAQPRYPFEFHQWDAIDWFANMIGSGEILEFAVVTGSPPCQRHTRAQTIRGREHPDFIPPFRKLCHEAARLFELNGRRLPWVIENVEGAPLIDPITLCGTMFPGLNTYRHRLFESNVLLVAPAHPAHTRTAIDMGRPLKPGDWYTAVGNFSGVSYVRENMGVPWMTREGIRECIPPVYTEYIGRQLHAML